MVFALDAALALIAFVGHFALAVYLFNRVLAKPWPWRFVKTLDRLIILGAAVVLLAGIVASAVYGGFAVNWRDGHFQMSWPVLAYVTICWACAALVLPLWLGPKLVERIPAALVANDTAVLDVAARLGYQPVGSAKARTLARVRGTQIFQPHIQRKTLRLANLPAELEGLTIAHLTDLHMTGDLTEEFYREIVAATNSLTPDLVAITGDILEKSPCLPWIPRTLGQLTARHGKFFILGNHELRLGDVAPLRQALVESGLIDLGSRALLHPVRETEILLAGTELPWFGTAPTLPLAPSPRFRLLLSHTPDQLTWARENGFDLMLAGHNHGGQIRLPWLGALISPSRFGSRYAGGVYDEPPTLLHVSRGISGVPPIRLNCPPEIALLVLTRG
ncbi:MAG: metallophosphoesterase [Pirellulaceae bacterium]|nr:metallophosphoesterase [Pirellulaceae bacterium]